MNYCIDCRTEPLSSRKKKEQERSSQFWPAEKEKYKKIKKYRNEKKVVNTTKYTEIENQFIIYQKLSTRSIYVIKLFQQITCMHNVNDCTYHRMYKRPY